MNTQISTKLAALGMALLMNSAIIGGVAYLFNTQVKAGDLMVARTELTTTAFC
jgi:hypothetical protein